MSPTLRASRHRAPVPSPSPSPSPAARDTNHDVLIFLFLVARSLDARRELAEIVHKRRTLEAQLDNPKLANHPKREAAERRYTLRQEREQAAAIKLMEENAAISRQWDVLSPQDKNKYQLTTLTGECDPQMNCLQSLWCRDRGLALLVPFPDGWTVPWQISFRVYDDTTGVRTYDIEEVVHAPAAPF